MPHSFKVKVKTQTHNLNNFFEVASAVGINCEMTSSVFLLIVNSGIIIRIDKTNFVQRDNSS